MDAEIVDQLGLDARTTHLNHGAYGVVPRTVRAAQAAWQARSEANPHRFDRVEAPGLVAAARARAAGFLGVDAGSVGLVRNVSEAVSAVLGSLDLAWGDEIVLADHGYGAVRLAAEVWARRRGARVVMASFALDADDDAIAAAYATATSAHTRLVVVDQITSPTAMVLPVAQVVTAVNAPVLVDAAHVPGSLPTDIAGLGATYWVGNLHKWAYTSRGTAALWVAEAARDTTWPSVLSWQVGGDLGARFDYPGTWDYSAWLVLGDGLDFWAGIGGWEMVDRCCGTARRAQEVVAEALGTSLDGLPLTPSPTMCLVPLPTGMLTAPADVDVLYERLSTGHRFEVAPIFFGGHGYVRIAAAAYNTDDDYERLAAALLAEAGQ